MTTIILNLILINAIVSLIFNSGFIDSIDDAINKKYPFHHLPKPFSCSLCTCTWVSFFYLLFTGNLTLLTLAIALFSATLTSVTQPLLKTIEGYLLKIIELLNRLLDAI